MRDETMNAEQQKDPWGQTIADALDPGPLPEQVQARLDRTYAALGRIPQEKPVKPRGTKRGTVILAAVLASTLVCGVAFAASNLIKMGEGDGAFFSEQKNLPVFSSMEAGSKALSASVGQTATIDGTQVTLDSISCDRNAANLYLTLHRAGGFDLESASVYDGSQESEWSRLQSLLPMLSYSLTSADRSLCTGDVQRLDAYQEGDDIKCLMRITPESVMGDEVELSIDGWSWNEGGSQAAFAFGLDLAEVPAPKELGSQTLTFPTQQGDKQLEIERFTASELACVMVVRNEETTWQADDGVDASGIPDPFLDPAFLKMVDDTGSVLYEVNAGDGQGTSTGDARIIELAGLSPDAQSVTFTPMDIEDARQDERIDIDVTRPDVKIPLTDFGGYELAHWSVEDQTVLFALKPYGWFPQGANLELLTDSVVPMISDTWTDPDTDESGTGYHSAIAWSKWDYATGELLQMHSYYRATPEELEGIHGYYAYGYAPGSFVEESAAAQTLSFA